MEWSDSSKVFKVKREADVAEATQVASLWDRVGSSDQRVKVERDIAAAPTPSASGCDTMDCYKPDPLHTSEVKIEIDVAEEIPQSWTVASPIQSKLSAALHIYASVSNNKHLGKFKITFPSER